MVEENQMIKYPETVDDFLDYAQHRIGTIYNITFAGWWDDVC